MDTLTHQSILSVIQSAKYIPGVLILENNRTFGRTANKKRLLYKCVPNNRELPSFLVPYEVTLGFSKSIPNKYVLFRFDSWEKENERPHGLLVEVLGDVTNRTVYYEYQLYCRELRHSIAPFIRIVREHAIHLPQYTASVGGMGSTNNPQTSYLVGGMGGRCPPFSIDPAGSTDLDDAFSISPHPTVPGNYIVSVYIANVFYMIETLGVWKSFSNRVSTIYLPNQKLPLLPPLLSDNVCSLLENEVRSAFIMDVEITSTGTLLTDTATFRTDQICVSRNYEYESPELLANNDYLELLRISKLADPSIHDSHDVVAFWMIQMNTICGSVLVRHNSPTQLVPPCSRNTANTFAPTSLRHSHNTCILRGGGGKQPTQDPTTTSEICLDNTLDDSTKRFLQNWKHTNCIYRVYDSTVTDTSAYHHAGLDTNTYAHMTSPIRRLVDIVNQTLFIHRLNLVDTISPDALDFCENWIAKIDYINKSMKSIRKLQMDCELIHLCETNPSLLTTVHSGIVFDKKCRDGFYSYMVYLKDLRRVARVRSIVDYPEHTSLSFRLFFFTDEDNIRDKVRSQIVDT
jgi:exoribonuclease R